MYNVFSAIFNVVEVGSIFRFTNISLELDYQSWLDVSGASNNSRNPLKRVGRNSIGICKVSDNSENPLKCFG